MMTSVSVVDAVVQSLTIAPDSGEALFIAGFVQC